jgi:EAL domain-containing protein (putative c-di-GMP-specific phosphodiesterase class I)
VLARDSRADDGARVEVSLSTKALVDPELHSFLAQQLEAASVAPQRLCIAIAETAAVQGTDRTALALRRLADLGCELGIDRFGAGVASFLHVERLPFSYVKLDGALVAGLADGEGARLVVKAITDVAHGLGMRTVAPHVLEHHTLRLLRELRVGYAQGPALALARAATELQLAPPQAVPRV